MHDPVWPYQDVKLRKQLQYENAMENVEVQHLVQCITVSLASGNGGSETALLLPFVAILHLEALPREEHSGHLAMAYDGDGGAPQTLELMFGAAWHTSNERHQER